MANTHALSQRMADLEVERNALFDIPEQEAPLDDGTVLTDDIALNMGSGLPDGDSPRESGQSGGYVFAPATKESDNFDENTWATIQSYFKNPTALTAHQIDSYNDCLTNIIPAVVAAEDSQVNIPFDFDTATGQPRREYKLRWGDVSIGRPVLQESNGVATLLTPAEARRRNITYSANLYVDIRHELHARNDAGAWGEPEVQEVKRIQISKLPLMIGSKYFVLSDMTTMTKSEIGECKFDKHAQFVSSC